MGDSLLLCPYQVPSAQGRQEAERRAGAGRQIQLELHRPRGERDQTSRPSRPSGR